MPYPSASNKNCAQWVNRLNKFYRETGVIAEVTEEMKRSRVNRKIASDNTGKFIEALCRIQRNGVVKNEGNLPKADTPTLPQGAPSQLNDALMRKIMAQQQQERAHEEEGPVTYTQVPEPAEEEPSTETYVAGQEASTDTYAPEGSQEEQEEES